MVELARALSRELQEHSTTVFFLAVLVMLLHVNGLRRRVKRLTGRQDALDVSIARTENDQGHIQASLTRIEGVLERHEADERGFWEEVRTYMNGGKKK